MKNRGPDCQFVDRDDGLGSLKGVRPSHPGRAHSSLTFATSVNVLRSILEDTTCLLRSLSKRARLARLFCSSAQISETNLVRPDLQESGISI